MSVKDASVHGRHVLVVAYRTDEVLVPPKRTEAKPNILSPQCIDIAPCPREALCLASRHFRRDFQPHLEAAYVDVFTTVPLLSSLLPWHWPD